MFSETVPQRVGPAQARTWLDTVNPDFYRPISEATVARLTAIIEQGLWEDTHDPILFDSRGQLRGGRMRLLAIEAAGREVQVSVHVPPSPQPRETRPGIYSATGAQPLVEAVRWDGDNFETIRDWVQRQPLGVDSIEHNAVYDLIWRRNDTRRPPEAVIPGDWIARRPEGYTAYRHLPFTDYFTYVGAPE